LSGQRVFLLDTARLFSFQPLRKKPFILSVFKEQQQSNGRMQNHKQEYIQLLIGNSNGMADKHHQFYTNPENGFHLQMLL
jgi:hypothetical protein